MEFRTDSLDPGGDDENEGGGGNDIFDEALERAKQELAKDPEKRIQLAAKLEENYGIDPQITSLFVPGLENDIQELENEGQNQSANPNMESTRNSGNNQPNPIPNKPENTEMPSQVEFTVDDMLEVVEKFQDFLGDEATLIEVKNFVENNRDIVERELEEYL